MFLGTAGAIHGQAPSWDWVRQSTGLGLATANTVIPGPENGFYIVGRFADSVRLGNQSLINSSHNILEFYIARCDAQGNCLWMKHIGGYNPPSNIFTGFYQFPTAVDELGNVYVETIADTLFLADTTLVGPSSFLIKFNQQGQRIWVRKLPKALYLKRGGRHLYLSGAAVGALQLDTVSLPPLGLASDVVVFKLDTAGKLIWGKRMGTSRFETCATMAVDKDENMVISGQFTDSVEFDGVKVVSINPGACANCNTYLAKLDSSGSVQWAKAYPGGLGGSPQLAFMPNGKLASIFGADDVRVLNPDGSVYWTRNIGNAVVKALTIGPKGQLTMAFARQDSASFPPYLFTKPINVPSPNLAFVLGVAQTDSVGNLLWAKGIPTANLYFDDLPSIACDTAGAVLVAGQASERTALDGYVISNTQQLTAFFAKTGAVTEMPHIKSHFTSDITLSPNPATSRTSVRWKGNYSSVHILEATGRVVRVAPLTPKQTSAEISLQNLSPGIYYIRLQGPSGTAVGRVVLRP